MASVVLSKSLRVQVCLEAFLSRDKGRFDGIRCPARRKERADRGSRADEDGLRGRYKSKHARRGNGDAGGGAERSSGAAAGRAWCRQEGDRPSGSRTLPARKAAVPRSFLCRDRAGEV